MLLCRFDHCIERQIVTFYLLFVRQVLGFDADVVLDEEGTLGWGHNIAVVLML